MTLDDDDLRITALREAVLDALDEAVIRVYGSINGGWQDADLPLLLPAIDAQACRVAERMAHGK